MRSRLEEWLLARWYGEKAPPGWLILLSKLYALLVGIRRRLYLNGILRIQRFDVPVIVVGNVTVGGSGKPPMVIALINTLKRSGFSPGVVSRGYGRRSKAALNVDATRTARECGDEPLLIFDRCAVPVRVDRNRVAACRALIEQGCDVIVSDDGLQHLSMGRQLEIELIDGRRSYGNHHLLPAGPLREPSDAPPIAPRIRIASHHSIDGIAHSMHLGVDSAYALETGEVRPLSEFAGQAVAAMAGVADPQKFFAALRDHGIAAMEFAFPDHHNYSEMELSEIPRPILMTEKDAVKCRRFSRQELWAVPLNAVIDDAFFAEVLSSIQSGRT